MATLRHTTESAVSPWDVPLILSEPTLKNKNQNTFKAPLQNINLY